MILRSWVLEDTWMIKYEDKRKMESFSMENMDCEWRSKVCDIERSSGGMSLCRVLSIAKGGRSVVVVFVKSEEQEGNTVVLAYFTDSADLIFRHLKMFNDSSNQIATETFFFQTCICSKDIKLQSIEQ